MNDTTNKSTPSVWKRRIKYGSNVAALLLGVLVIVVFANWLAVRKARSWGAWARIDMTATRAYTLAPQTRKVLGNLAQPVKIVTLFVEGGQMDAQTVEKIRAFRDLLDEYDLRGGDRIEVEHINAAIDVTRFEQFAGQLRQRYAEKLQAMDTALQTALQGYDQVSVFGKDQAATFARLMPRLGNLDPQTSEFFKQVGTMLADMDGRLELETRRTRVAEATDSTLPNYAGAKAVAAEPLTALKGGLLEPALANFARLKQRADAPAELRELIAAAEPAFRKMLEQVNTALGALDAPDIQEYTATRDNILEADSAVVMTDADLTVLKLDDVYTDSMLAGDETAAPEQRFRGEEAVTGAIISLTLNVKPLVVMVNPATQAATGPGGTYSHVADRLTNMNFEVQEWNPAGRQTQFGAMPPQPRPQPAPGQPVVWVFLSPPPDNPMMPGNPGAEPAAQTLGEVLQRGEPAMVFVAVSPMARFGQPDPILEYLKPLGITPDSASQVMVNQVSPDGRQASTPTLDITRWPAGHAIAEALAGQVGVVLAGVPLSISEVEGVQTSPLIRTPDDAWAESDLMSRDPKRDAHEPGGPLTVALAAQKDKQRLVVIGDAVFASDEITQYGPRDFLTGRLVRVVFPANAELFVNSVYWLAGMDELIATSPRTQDVRRFEDISPAAAIAVWWVVLAGLPVLCLAAGGVVWFARRK